MRSYLTRLLTGSLAVSLAAYLLIAAAPQAQAQDKVLRVGTLKLIHGISAYFYEKFVPPGYTVEVIPFESPTDGKNAVLTGTVDTCIHGIAAFILGAAAGEPVVIVANANNGGMAVMAGVNTGIKTHQGPQGQEGRDLAGLDAGGRDPRAAAHGGHVDQGHPADPAAVQRSCRQRSRAATSTPMSAPSRRPGITSPTAPAGWSSIPYSTPIGPLNMILSASQKAVKENPERIKLVVDMHKKAVDYAMANPPQIVDMAMQKLGQQKEVGRARGARTWSSPGSSMTCSCSARCLHQADVREQADPPGDRSQPVRHHGSSSSSLSDRGSS